MFCRNDFLQVLTHACLHMVRQVQEKRMLSLVLATESRSYTMMGIDHKDVCLHAAGTI